MRNERGGAAGLILTFDLGALAANWRRVAAEAAPAECAAVVKADAYGIGIEHAVSALAAAGCRTFFVALPEEGRRVRAVAAEAAIYVLNGLLLEVADIYRNAELRPVLNSLEDVRNWARLGDGARSAVHVDTGMNRLGLPLRDALELARRPDLLARIAPHLLISHLACADNPVNPNSWTQLALFREIRGEFPDLPASLANSAGIFLGKDYHFDMARPGIALYGGGYAVDRPPLRTVVTMKARILQVREAAAGDTIGYGAAEHLKHDSRVAILSAGYANGFPRSGGSSDQRGGASAYVRGRPARLLGRVSMDLTAIDVTGIPGVTQGDWVELFGANMPIDEVAKAAGTIGYELLTGLSRRAERIYLDGGKSS